MQVYTEFIEGINLDKLVAVINGDEEKQATRIERIILLLTKYCSHFGQLAER